MIFLVFLYIKELLTFFVNHLTENRKQNLRFYESYPALFSGRNKKNIHIPYGKQCKSKSVGFFRSQLIWIYTVCKGRVYPGSAGQGLKS